MIVDVEGHNLELMFVQARLLVSGEPDVTLHATVDRYSDAHDRTCKLVLASNLGSKRYRLQTLQHGSCQVEIVTCFGNATWEFRDDYYYPVHEEWPSSFVAEAYFASLCKLAMWKHASHGDRSSSDPWPLRASRCSKEFPHAGNYPFEFLRHESIENEPLANVIKHKLRPMVSTLLEDGNLLRIQMMTIEVQRSRFRQYARGAIEGGTEGVKTGGAIGGALGACTAGIAAVPLDIAVSSGVGAVAASMAAAGGVFAATLGGGIGAAVGVMKGAVKVADEPRQFRETEVFVENYRHSLQLLLEVLWNVKRNTADSELEMDIFRRSKPQDELRTLREQIRNGCLRERVPERYRGSRDARFIEKTLLQIVDRAALIYDICRADEYLHHAWKVILVVGEENVGKSSLLKCILSKCGRDRLAESIEVGETTHTRNLKVYRCNLKLSGGGSGDLLLVDAPRTSTPEHRNEDSFAWQCMERVPDMCFAMIEFKGDVQKGDAELIKDIHERKVCLRQNQLLLVNRMDSRLHGNRRARVWREFNRNKMEELRSQFAKNSGIREQTVLMTVLNDESLFDEEMSLLRERGVLVQEEATQKILSILRGLFTN